MSAQQLPTTVQKYAQVPTHPKRFTYDSIPKGLRKDHSTKSGVWGIIRVYAGELEYTIGESVQLLTPQSPGIIPPQELHHVRPISNDVEFVVEFYK